MYIVCTHSRIRTSYRIYNCSLISIGLFLLKQMLAFILIYVILDTKIYNICTADENIIYAPKIFVLLYKFIIFNKAFVTHNISLLLLVKISNFIFLIYYVYQFFAFFFIDYSLCNYRPFNYRKCDCCRSLLL